MTKHLYPNPYPIKLFSCGPNQDLAKKISKLLKLELETPVPKVFSNGEFLSHQQNSVRFRDVFVICQPRQGNKEELSYDLDECYSLIFALRQGSPSSITVIMPYLPYSRQDRSSNHREPVLSQKVGIMLQAVGADKLVVLKIHSPSSYNANPETVQMELVDTDDLIIQHIKSKKFDLKKLKFVAPDVSAAVYAKIMSDRLGVNNDIVIVYKHRDHKSSNKAKVVEIVGNPEGYDLIMIDDMADTLGTAVEGFLELKKRGARNVYLGVTHAILSGKALENIQRASFAGLWFTDTCPIGPEKIKHLPKLEIISTANLIANIIKNLHDGKSVTTLWNK